MALLTLSAVHAPAQSVDVSADNATAESPKQADSPQSNRVVHDYDFNERAEGNLEPLPRYWVPFRPRGFPRFTSINSKLDYQHGRNDEASFYLSSEGRNVAYIYRGPETQIQPSTSYRIEGYIQPHALNHARARFSAVYLDEDRKPIVDTLVNSRYVAGTGSGNPWQHVELYLEPPPPAARTIGLIAWVVQKSTWDAGQRIRRYIPLVDVEAGAWFDDIVIHALPHISMTSSSPGNVLAPGGPQEIRVILADYLDETLKGRLTIESVEGVVLSEHDIPVRLGAPAKPRRFDMQHLPPGVYVAHLYVYSCGEIVDHRHLRFARLAAEREDDESLARPFGVVVDAHHRAPAEVEYDLFRRQLTKSAKLPVWSGMIERARTAEDWRATNELLRKMIEDGYSLTAVFAGPPSALVESAGAYDRPLVEILSESPDAWRDQLAAVLAPYASFFRSWQVGPDNDPPLVEDERLPKALAQLRQEMLRYINTPLLAVPGVSFLEPGPEKLPAEYLTLAIDHSVLPAWFRDHLTVYERLGYQQLSIYVDPLAAPRYERLPRLADWIKRILYARFAGADAVYVPQTWTVRHGYRRTIAEPTEEYVIMRTIADLLGDAKPGGQFDVGEHGHVMIFHKSRTSVAVLWDAYAGTTGRDYTLQLGQADEQIDAWGVSQPLRKGEDGRQVVRLSAMPTFVPNIERWLMEFRMSARIKPATIEFGNRYHRFQVSLGNNSARHIVGSARFGVPEYWESLPRDFNISIAPAHEQQTAVEMTFPHTEPAGKKRIVLQTNLSQGYYMDIPLTLELGLKELEVWALPFVEGDDLILRHVVRNRSDEVLFFRGSASIPGKARQYQPFTNLQPGNTIIAEYRFAGGAKLSGKKARLTLRELNDGRRLHNLVVVIP